MKLLDELKPADTTMDFETFVTEADTGTSQLSVTINNNDDGSAQFIYGRGEFVNIRLITTNLYRTHNGAYYDAQVWGMDFEEIANFVDAVRAIKKPKANL